MKCGIGFKGFLAILDVTHDATTNAETRLRVKISETFFKIIRIEG